LLLGVAAAGCRVDQAPDSERRTFDMGTLRAEARFPDTVPQLGTVAVDITWEPGPDFSAPPGEVMVWLEFVDRDGRVRFFDMHPPDVAVGDWAPGDRVGYRHFVLAPWAAPVGRYVVRAGFRWASDTDIRFVFTPAANRERIDAILLGELQLSPRQPGREPRYTQGWLPLEVDVDDTWRTWRWTTGDATMLFRGFEGQRTLHLWLQAPDAAPGFVQPLTIEADRRVLAERTQTDGKPFYWPVQVTSPCGAECGLEVVLRLGRLFSTEGAQERRLGLMVLSVYLE
jgi:hypothetical protein